MQHAWMNDGKPDAEGNYTAVVREDDGPNGEPGQVVSTFKGRSFRRIANQLLESAANASGEIARARANRPPDQAPVKQPITIAPKPLSIDDNFRLSMDLANPDKAPAAVQEIVTRATGATPEQIGTVVSEAEQRRFDQYVREEAAAFMRENPDYFAHKTNETRMLQTLDLKRFDLTRNNLAIVYHELKGQGLLIERPAGQLEADENGEPNRSQQQQGPNLPQESNPPSQTRPRMVTTGMRSSDTSAQRPAPAAPKPKWTVQQIEEMSKADYDQNFRNPAFRNFVNTMRPRKQA